jgi:hypothetical protein
MDDIPGDVMDAAMIAVEEMPARPPFKDDMHRAIAHAIMAERERCAIVAREESCGACRVLDSFAQAIRKGA